MSQVRAVGYVRVSTEEQRDGHGLRVQEDAIRAYCQSKRLRLVAVVRDEGLSGSNGLDSREGLADALHLLRSREASALIVYRLDRLSRDQVLQEQLLREMWQIGAEVRSTSEAEAHYLTDDPDDPSRALIRKILGAVAEYEAGMIRLRMRSGRRRKAAQGGYIGGLAPYGKMPAGDGSLAPVETEEKAVARIVELRQAGASYRAICTALEAEGIKPRKAGASWQPAVVRRIALREV